MRNPIIAITMMNAVTNRSCSISNNSTKGDEPEAIVLTCREGSGGLGYFIRLPRNTAVAVNGRAYMNEDEQEEFFIGPLEDFAVIEFFGQPVFFWRGKEMLHWDGPCSKPVSTEEKAGRYTAEEGEGPIKLIWRGLRLPHPDSTRPAPSPGKKSPRQPPVSKSLSRVSKPASTRSSKSASRSRRSYLVRHPLALEAAIVGASGTVLEDPFTVDKSGEEITTGAFGADTPSIEVETAKVFDGKGPCEYLQGRLTELDASINQACKKWEGSLLQDLPNLVNVVLRAINIKQPENAGFSILDSAGVICPGRPLIVPLNDDEHPVLLVVQFDQLSSNGWISLHVLDPLAWNADEDIRTRIYREGLEKIVGGWISDVPKHIDTTLQMTILPSHASFAYSARTGFDDRAPVYVVLTAWALAMGQSLNPNFQASQEDDDFITQARSLFYLALSSQDLDWRLLHAFFRCHGFTLEKSIPPKDRRFRLSNRPTRRLASQKESAKLKARDLIKQSVSVPRGRPHNIRWPTDSQPPEFREKEVRQLVKVNRWNSGATYDTLKKRIGVRRRSASSYPTRSRSPSEDTVEAIPPCQYFRTKLAAKLRRSEGFEGGVHKLSPEQTWEAVIAVSLAINNLQQENGWVPVYWNDELFQPHPGGLLVMPYRTKDYDHSVTVAIQDPKPNNLSVRCKVRILDSASWTLDLRQRERVYNGVRKMIERAKLKPKAPPVQTIRWVPSAQQTENWQDSYFTIFNAWCLFLGLEPNFNFRATEDFFYNALQLILLALAGQASWKLIWAFLRCYNFVLRGDPPKKQLRFPQTVASADIGSQFEEQRTRVWPPAIDGSVHAIPRFSLGFNHNSNLQSDNWTNTDKDLRVPVLQGQRSLHHNLKPHQLRQRYRNTVIDSPLSALDLLQGSDTAKMEAALKNRGESILKRRDELFSLALGSLQTGDRAQLEQHLISGGKDTQMTKFELFTRLMDSVRLATSNGIHRVDETRCSYYRKALGIIKEVEGKRGHQISTNLADDLKEQDCFLAIASVVEAIMTRQDDVSALGGFALAASPDAEEKDAIISRPRRVWLLPCTFDYETISEYCEKSSRKIDPLPRSHTILLVHQEVGNNSLQQGARSPRTGRSELEAGQDKRGFKTYILDSDQKYLYPEYKKIVPKVRGLPSVKAWSRHRNAEGLVTFKNFDLKHDPVKVARQTGLHTSGIHTVLNAWICALNLTPSEDSPTKEKDFYKDARDLIQAAVVGLVDWSIIAAFLLCQKLVRERTLNAVPEDRRFHVTKLQTTMGDLEKRIRKMIEEDEKVEQERPDDELDLYDFRNNIDRRSEPLVQLDPSRSLPSTCPEIPENTQPSEYLKKELNRLSNVLNGSNWIQEMRRTEFQDEESLNDREVALSIASITLAITKHQPREDGLSIILDSDIQRYLQGNSQDAAMFAVRPCRPLLVPIRYKDHIVLVLIQLQLDGAITFSLANSRSWLYTHTERETLHRMILNLVQGSKWARLIFSEPEFPDSTMVLNVAQQGGDWQCGYYTIFNAWALAMGLDLNPGFVWSDAFFEQGRDVILLAREGYADWRLVYAFLYCSNFVQDKGRPLLRMAKFFRSAALRDANVQVHELMILAAIDSEYKEIFRRGLEHRGRLPFYYIETPPGGQRHQEKMPSDQWNEDEGHLSIALQLERLGKLDLKADSEKLFMDFLRAQHDGLDRFIKQHSHKVGTLQEWAASFEEAAIKPQPDSRLETDPCGLWKERNAFLSPFEAFFSINPNQTDKPHKLEPYGEWCNDDSAVMAIAAVVEGIERLQQEMYSHDGEFSAGFSMASSSLIQMGRSGVSIGIQSVSRKRRCWLLPWTVDELYHLSAQARAARVTVEVLRTVFKYSATPLQGANHIFLVAVQETQGGKVEVWYLDSADHIFKKPEKGIFYRDIQEMVRNLQWHDNGLVFKHNHREARVSQQKGGWECGYHTILNAWILAMGLKPNPKSELDEKILEELHGELIPQALCGILDWLTLVAWLFCHKLVRETTLDDVLMDRRFERTRSQTDESKLAARISDMAIADQQALTSGDADRWNNVTLEDKQASSSGFSSQTQGYASRAVDNANEWMRGFSDEEDSVMMDVDLDFLDNIPDPGKRISMYL